MPILAISQYNHNVDIPELPCPLQDFMIIYLLEDKSECLFCSILNVMEFY